MKRHSPLFIFLIIAVAFLAGCSKSGDPAVAIVNGEEIPVSLIHDYFDKGGWTFESFDEELKTKRAAVDSVIDYKLLVKGAYDAGLANDPEIEKVIQSKHVDFLFDVLYAKELAPSTDVTEDEVREFYKRLEEERHVFHIMLATKEQADSVIKELNNGQDFGNIARAISTDQSSAVQGGDLGWMNWGTSVIEEFRQAIFTLQVNQTSEPVKTPYGYHVIRITESRPVKLEPYEMLAPYIREALKSRKTANVQAKFLEGIEKAAAVEINPEATAMLLERLDMYYPDSLNKAARPDNYFPNLDLLKPFEQQTVLASYTGGEVTVEGYINKIENVPEAARPRFDDVEGLRRTILQLELKNIVEYEAEQKKIQDTDEFLKRISDFREGLMVDKFTRQEIARQIDVSEDEMIEYYNAHVEEFTVPQEYHVLEIQSDSALGLGPIIEQLKTGADFKEMAAKHSGRPGAPTSKGDLGFVQKSRLPMLWEAASNLREGTISDIVQNDEGTFSVIKVLEIKQPIVHPLEQVVSQVRASVLDLKRSSATLDWLKQAREKSSIEIHANVLEETIDKSKYANKG